ncbi:hypothetical protein SS1G_05168 [Sclerotinia sclerotiorum 1980 UF-70]|uniref:Nephrocystin 3-like N-terminal domain-containing protein n=1 Tax=Sclerotinia sclerotiorum (strain ATCC 18683 / 1980 / Ss-1) TaxID=665079 RepID=A7EIM5_SCLS1|nr:hypothetical protein SS1G_05168 [Sclerotinia sclerotiorum 1980 UF-70]EDO02691.1 hypothetical protein SS1G_05168 [Sclerotinia sclerotiorum 1980 UF-70]
MDSEMSSDEFEMVESGDIVKQMLADEKPDLAAIRAWLNPTDYLASSSEFNRHASSKSPETGEWIRKTSQFKQWHSSADHGSIWIKAVPGAGKSVLAASMVQSLSMHESVPVLFFFFRQIIETNRTSRGLLQDWMYQLLPFSEILQLNLFGYVKNKQSQESVSTEELWKHLLAGLKSLERVYCIADALDEMDMDEDFLSRLNVLGSFRPAQVKVLLTSRPKEYLQRALKSPQVIHVSLEEELVKRDISVFVRQRVMEFEMGGIDESYFIEKTVCERSQGLFLYARLMLDQIGHSIKEKNYKEASIPEMIAKLPVGLEEMYNRLLLNHALLTNIHQDIQVIILRLITQSARPMRLIEIGKAIEDNPQVLRSGKDSKDIVRSACGPLLEIMEDGVVQILHHSFTEFLLDVGRTTSTTLDFPQFPVIDPKNAHREIALICISQLQGVAFSADSMLDGIVCGGSKAPRRVAGFSKQQEFNFRQLFIQYPLAEYAATKWTYHAKRYDYEDPSFYERLEEFCNHENQAFKSWCILVGKSRKAFSMNDFQRNFDPCIALENVSQLHIASGFGLVCWTQRLVEKGADLDILDGTENTPLFWAAKGGHFGVAQKLLDAGAQPNIDGYYGLKPLHVAASHNHAGVVKLLLSAGVSPLTPKTKDVDTVGRCCKISRSNPFNHPLMFASNSGHLETVIEMIPYCGTKDLERSLLQSAYHGHHALVSTLLERTDVSPNAKALLGKGDINKIGGQTALMVATSSLEPKSVKVLLEKGAIASLPGTSKNDVPAPRTKLLVNPFKLEGRTPLHNLAIAAVAEEEQAAAKEILDMLLLAGADLEARDDNGYTPLLLTVVTARLTPMTDVDKFCQNFMKLLLSAGANPCAMSSNGETLLHRACAALPSTNVAKQLLAFGANPNQAQISNGFTPLHCVVGNTAEHIQLLVSHGADINAQDTEGDSPLHRACRSHSIRPNLNIQNKLGETCLHNINIGIDTGVINSIIDAGIDLEIRDLEGMTVLLRAVNRNMCSSTEMKKIETLLKHPRKASISARAWPQGKTALHLACHKRNSIDILELLVKYGADLTWTDSTNGNSLLHEVAEFFDGRSTNTALIEYLYQNGVSVNARNYRQQTALHIMEPVQSYIQPSRSIANRETFISIILRLCPEFDVNVKDTENYTPFHYACATSESSAFALVKAGAELDVKAFNGRTPLHCAARGRQCGIISMLLSQAQNESAKSKKLAEIQTMAPMVNVAKALDECIDTDINLTSHIPELDEITMDHMVARGVDFTKGIMKNDVYSGPPIARLAYYGLTEFMKKILSSAKLFDDPKFTSSITESSDCKFYAWRGIRPLLQMACQRSIWNMDMVKLLVEEGQVDLNAHQMLREVENGTMTDKIQGTTALHILAEGNFWWQIEAVTYLGEHGAEVDILDENGRTPLEIASTYSEHSSKIGRKFFRPQCCEALLKLGANPNKINPEGLTALNKAGSDRDTVQLLLKYGADINAGMKGLLASAIESGDVKILQLCLENGADPNVPDHSTDSSFRAQHEKGNVAREYPIVTAALQNRYKKYSVSTAVEMIELLLDHGARVDLPIDQEQTILHHLFANATSATLQPFFERSGIDMNSRDQSGRTVLLSAISNPTATELEEHTVRPGRHQPQSRYVNPCIHLINSKTHGSSLDFLAVDNEGRHIIFYLIYRWTTEVSSLLLSIPGVRSLITQKDNAGYSPLHHAFAAPRFTPHFPITKIVDTFLNEGGTDLLEPDPQSDTALHYISRKLPSEPPGLLPFMDRFIALGCDMNARNDMGMTPLLEYLQCSRYQSNLPWFKEHGADFKVKNNEGEGALHIVAKKKAYISAWRKVNEERNPVAQLFEVLVKEYGCEVLDEDEKGRTALDIAAAVGNQKILELFQRKR